MEGEKEEKIRDIVLHFIEPAKRASKQAKCFFIDIYIVCDERKEGESEDEPKKKDGDGEKERSETRAVMRKGGWG